MNQLMSGVRDHHVDAETAKLAKKPFDDFDKSVQRLQLAVIQHREKTGRDIRMIAEYILNAFKRANDDFLEDLSAHSRADLRKVDLIICEQKLMTDPQAEAFRGGGLSKARQRLLAELRSRKLLSQLLNLEQ